MNRKSGVLMHISSLFGDYSIGGFSKHTEYFIDFLSDCGFTYWQVLPFCMTDQYNSPYKSYSAFAGNPYFIDLEALHAQGLLTQEELLSAKQQTPYCCEFERLHSERLSLLARAAGRIKDRTPIQTFIEKRPYLAQFCRFMALKDANEGVCWIDWRCYETPEERLFLWQFIQFTFFTQWAKVKAYANQKGIKIIGDVPFYVSYDSADVWANQNQFQLDEKGHPLCVAVVPPDYFCSEGQLWGNPLYDWQSMEQDGFWWWRMRMEHMLTLFDGVRIDHFRALDSYWSVEAGAKTAQFGKWEKGPGRKLIDALSDLTIGALMIAEDLGEITEEVHALVNYSGFLSMRVLQFGFLDERDSFHKPHHYRERCVVYTGTHDNNTLLGYVWELSEERRRELLGYCGFSGADWNQSYDSILQTMLRSHAGLVIFPIQDLLGFGSDTRMNTPGTTEGNWQFRLTKEQLDGIDRQKLKDLNRLFSRL